ncbi:hypothetical protein SAMD00019534_048380, partial [Acytostelium subglobosum LB1]|uniref:hypothetical protein n=1 Tax=Acytostelium subglobosum LB1 TaxID=1410327 RepID=UPI000644DBB7
LFHYLIACHGPDSAQGLLSWSNPSTWPNSQVPRAGDFVEIQSGMNVLLDVSTASLAQIWIYPNAKLIFSSTNGPIELTTGGIIIEGGLYIGDDNCRYNGSAIITLTGIEGVGYIEKKYDMLQKYIGVLPGGKLELHGIYSYPIPTWVFLTKTIMQNDTLLTLSQDVSMWPVGSKIAIGSTDFDYLQSEDNEIIKCSNCAKNQLMLKQGVKHYHYGEITYGVDERAEVGLLTKTILIRGQTQDKCNGSKLCSFFDFDGFGGHIKVIKGFGSVHIQGIEVTKMGQLYNLGYYPIHFHMCGDVDTGAYAAWPTFVKDVSIHHTLSRCLTIHGTSGLIVVNNFAFDHYGHCYFFEDGSEQRNYLDSNVGLLTRFGYILPSDRSPDLCTYLTPKDYNGYDLSPITCDAVSTFWITNPNNVFKNNIAGGSAKAGIWYLFSDHPSGMSTSIYPNIFPPYTALGVFSNNKAHSNTDSGMNVDQAQVLATESNSSPLPTMSMTYSRYKPRVDPTNPDSAIAPAFFYKYVAYKNKWRGLWARGGQISFLQSQFADNAIGATLAAEGVMQADPGTWQSFIGCKFIAETDNIGSTSNGINVYKGRTIPAWQQFNQRGMELYDGPMNVQWSEFINYNSDGVRNMSAIGFFLYDWWNMDPKSKFQGVKFTNTNSRVFHLQSTEDGVKTEAFLDIDGSVTGTAGASVVPTSSGYFSSPRCVPNDQWHMSTCYEKFSNLYIYNMDMANTKFPAGKAGILMVRDQYSKDRSMTLAGVPNSNPTNTFMPLVMIGRSYTLHFVHPSPPKLRIQMTNFDKGDSVIVGICYPTWGVSFVVERNTVFTWHTYVAPMTKGNSIADVNADPLGNTWFYDSNSGLLFLRFTQNNTRPWNYYCPKEGCESLNIVATGSGLGTNTGDCTNVYGAGGMLSNIREQPLELGGCNGDPTLKLDRCNICGGNGTLCGGDGRPNSASSLSPSHFTIIISIIPSLLLLFIFVIY